MENTLEEQLAQAVDQWFGEAMLQIGPLITTDVYNKLSAQRDRLKERVVALAVAQ